MLPECIWPKNMSPFCWKFFILEETCQIIVRMKSLWDIWVVSMIDESKRVVGSRGGKFYVQEFVLGLWACEERGSYGVRQAFLEKSSWLQYREWTVGHLKSKQIKQLKLFLSPVEMLEGRPKARTHYNQSMPLPDNHQRKEHRCVLQADFLLFSLPLSFLEFNVDFVPLSCIMQAP